MRQIGLGRDFEREIPERGGQKPIAGEKQSKNAPKCDAKQRPGSPIMEMLIRAEIHADAGRCFEVRAETASVVFPLTLSLSITIMLSQIKNSSYLAI